MLVNNVGSPLIMSQSQTEGIVVEVRIYIYKHQLFTIPQSKEKMTVYRLSFTVELYEPRK